MLGKSYSAGLVGPSVMFANPAWGPETNTGSMTGVAKSFWESMKAGI